MGVPVISIQGDRHASRVSASILNRLDLAELIAASETDYIDLAVQLAKEPQQLIEWRLDLRKLMRASSLCDSKAFARDMELIFRQLWQNWCCNKV